MIQQLTKNDFRMLSALEQFGSILANSSMTLIKLTWRRFRVRNMVTADTLFTKKTLRDKMLSVSGSFQACAADGTLEICG